MLTLTIEQYLAIERLRLSLSQRESITSVALISYAEPVEFMRLTFDAGWGTIEFDIDREGNSAQVVFGSSEIAC